MKSATIIGAGLGGLFLGAILAKEGIQTTIIEKNSTIGGGLQSFHRFGESFDTGMHIIGGMQQGGNIRRICDYLGITDRMQIKDVDTDCCDTLYFHEDQQFYNIANTKQGFISSLSAYFPDQKQGLEQYVEAIYQIANSFDHFNLRPVQSPFSMALNDNCLISADRFIAQYISNDKLRSILAYMNPLYSGIGGKTPAYIHAIINVLYINGSSRFVGGSLQFAELLASTITSNGGKIIKNDAAAQIIIENKSAQEIITQKGLSFKSDYYISAIDPSALTKLLPSKAFSKAYTERINSIPMSYSAFSLFIKLKKESFPYINSSQYYMSNYKDIWNFDKRAFGLGFLFMTPPKTNHDTYASTALITAPMLYDNVKAWENTTTSNRGASYEAFKSQSTEILLNKMEHLHPGFKHCIDKINSASPLTIRDFYGSKHGGLSGFVKDCNNLALTQLPVVTKIHNLYLTGQNNNLHGFCGVPLTAINTAEAILGQNYIINKLNNI